MMPNSAETHPGKITLAYLTCPQDAANGFLGALMLTDDQTRPLHFGYVSPIRPTRIQRILFGSQIEEVVKVETIARNLIAGISTSPTVYFVDTEDLLAVRKVTGKPTAFLAKNAGEGEEARRLSSVRYSVWPGHRDEDLQRIGGIVADLETRIDLLEPFLRMREALKEVLKGEEKT
jgi:hypothetical protein